MVQTDFADCQPRALPEANLLLAALPAQERERIAALLEPVQFEAGAVLQDGASPPSSLLFPTRGLVALTAPLADGSAVAVAVLGRDAFVGGALFLDAAASPGQAFAQCSGAALRLPARALRHVAVPGSPLAALLLRSVQAQLAQAAQTAACNRHHTLDQQVCRWLLLALDRQDGPALVMTHELIAQLLGVRREGVTAAAGKLQDAGAIEYSRGRITVLERAILERRACECYRVVRAEERRLLPPPAPPHAACAPQMHATHATHPTHPTHPTHAAPGPHATRGERVIHDAHGAQQVEALPAERRA
jgi:CRP-like cAMP-binding protein